MNKRTLDPNEPADKSPPRRMGDIPPLLSESIAKIQRSLPGVELGAAIEQQLEREAKAPPTEVFSRAQRQQREIAADRRRALEQASSAAEERAEPSNRAARGMAPVRELLDSALEIARAPTRVPATSNDSKPKRSRRVRSAAARSVDVQRRSKRRRMTARRKKTRDELIADVESKGGLGYRPAEIPGHVRPMHRLIDLDVTGARAKAAIASWPRRLRGFRRIVVEAALGLDVERSDDFTDVRSRRIIAYANTLVMLSHGTPRHGFAKVVEGYSRGALAQLSVNLDTGMPCTVSYIFATSHDASRTGIDDCGPMTVLRRSGALLADQPPEWASNPKFLGIPKPRMVNGVRVMVRNALNVYWISARYHPPPSLGA